MHELTRYSNDGHYKAIRDDYMTPLDIYQPLLDSFKCKEFDIDVCCTKHNIPAKKYFTKEIDGLKQDWQGLVFCNPPWKFTSKWIIKGVELVHYNENLNCCYVIPADRLYVNYMQENVLNNKYAAFCILPKKQGFIIPGAEDLDIIPSVGVMILILSRQAPEIVQRFNELNLFKTTFFLGGNLTSTQLKIGEQKC